MPTPLAIPTILAENAGLQPVQVVTELRNWHAKGYPNHGINVRKSCVSDMVDEHVLQPLLVQHFGRLPRRRDCKHDPQD